MQQTLQTLPGSSLEPLPCELASPSHESKGQAGISLNVRKYKLWTGLMKGPIKLTFRERKQAWWGWMTIQAIHYGHRRENYKGEDIRWEGRDSYWSTDEELRIRRMYNKGKYLFTIPCVAIACRTFYVLHALESKLVSFIKYPNPFHYCCVGGIGYLIGQRFYDNRYFHYFFHLENSTLAKEGRFTIWTQNPNHPYLKGYENEFSDFLKTNEPKVGKPQKRYFTPTVHS